MSIQAAIPQRTVRGPGRVQTLYLQVGRSGELSPDCHPKPAEAAKSDIFELRGILSGFYFLEVTEREKDAKSLDENLAYRLT
jgi:hypothetical protein